ncbi:MAG: hypothetical protein M3323_12945 [Actinomycetota bacterium]|nr:hypothetical protein [Actinomycetota bacterium]
MVGSGGTAPGAAGTGDEWEKRKEIFKVGYTEVLSALKHQDDKLGRALAAQAFLTAAGITIFTQLGKTSTLKFGDEGITAPLIFFIAFLVAIALALGFTLSAIGPSTPFKRKELPGGGSLIYYGLIRKDADWDAYLTQRTDEQLTEMLARNFHGEARDLATRVHYKVRRAREAAAFLHTGLTALALLGVFSLTDVGDTTRWRIAAGVVLLASLLPLWDYFHMWKLDFPDDDPDEATYWLLGAAVVVAGALLALAPERDAEWWALGYGLGLVLASRWGLLSHAFARSLLTAAVVVGFAILVFVIFFI